MKLGGDGSQRGASRAFAIYNLSRLGLLLVCLGLGWLAGLRSYAVILAALLVSGILSWFLLRNQREAMGVAVERTVERSRERLAAKTAAEDAYVDDMLHNSENLHAREKLHTSESPGQPAP